MTISGFNPKARWDRHVPETEESLDPGEMNEKIEVLAYFKGFKIIPRAFVRNNRVHRIKRSPITGRSGAAGRS